MTSIVASANDNFEKRSNRSFKTVQRENLDQNEIIGVRPKNVEQQKKSVDEEHWEKTGGDKGGKVISPIVGSVFYPVPMDIEGGYLEIFTKGMDKEPERIEAKFNRLIVFGAGDYFHRVTPVTKGVRSAIAINLWEKAPTGVKSGSMIIEDAMV